MGSKHLGADVNLAWPTAQIAVVGAQGAVGILYRKELAAADDPDARRARADRRVRGHPGQPLHRRRPRLRRRGHPAVAHPRAGHQGAAGAGQQARRPCRRRSTGTSRCEPDTPTSGASAPGRPRASRTAEELAALTVVVARALPAAGPAAAGARSAPGPPTPTRTAGRCSTGRAAGGRPGGSRERRSAGWCWPRASPARLALLRQAGLAPEVVVSHVDESTVTAPRVAEQVALLAAAKATAVAKQRDRRAGHRRATRCWSSAASRWASRPTPHDARDRWQRMAGRSRHRCTPGRRSSTSGTARSSAGDVAVASTVVHFAQPDPAGARGLPGHRRTAGRRRRVHPRRARRPVRPPGRGRPRRRASGCR